MEGLRRLEQVQSTIHLLQSIGVNVAAADSERFLANFVLLLMQPCGELDINTKCQLISEYMPKISTAFFEGLQCVHGEGDDQIENAVPLHWGNEALNPVQYINRDVAMIGLEDMQRANSTIEDFFRSYLMFHNMDVNQPRSIFRYLPVLSLTESYIYQLDRLNEKLVQLPTLGRDSKLKLQNQQSLCVESFGTFGNEPFRPLKMVLEHHGLLTERIGEELKSGEEYWALERKLCIALESGKEISIEEAKRAIHIKSFDYRVLNLLMYQLRGGKVNEVHMEFLSISELLVEVSDDLFDYEDDVLENNFNILRMFVKYYGASAAPTILAKFIAEAEEKYDDLLKALGPELSKRYQKRCEEATKEGGKIWGPPLGTWHIPTIIQDEAKYRLEFSKSVPSGV